MMIMRTAKDDLAAFHYAEAMAFRGFRICGFCPRPTSYGDWIVVGQNDYVAMAKADWDGLCDRVDDSYQNLEAGRDINARVPKDGKERNRRDTA